VVEKFTIAITTRDRPQALCRLLHDIVESAGDYEVEVFVLDDRSRRSYASVQKILDEHGWHYVRPPMHCGKAGYWKLINSAFQMFRSAPADYRLLLQDDIRLCQDFFGRALTLWRGLQDPTTLYLLRDDGDESRWTSEPITRGRDADLVGWVDCAAFLFTDEMLERLSWFLQPVAANWDNPHESSGVGRQISQRLLRQRCRLYRCVRSLVVHAEGASQMNQLERKIHPMSTVAFIDGDVRARALSGAHDPVTVSLATVPEREHMLRGVVQALLPDADQVNVYLNGYAGIPEFLDHPRIQVATSQDHGDRGDAGKFFWSDRVEGYHLTCDDDIAYPPDYVSRVLLGIEKYGRRAAVGFHGSILQPPVSMRRRKMLHFASKLPVDTGVHVLGTGTLGYHTSRMTVHPTDFQVPNMADVWFALLCQHQTVPCVCLQRQLRWLKPAETEGGSIYASSKHRDGTSMDTSEQQDAALQSWRSWRIHSPGAGGEEPHAKWGRTGSVARPVRKRVQR